MKKNVSSDTNIFDAAEKGDLQTITYLVNQRGIRVNSKTTSGGTALMKAAEIGNLEVIKFLLQKGANINQSDKYGYTALLWAVDKHLADVSTIKYLVEQKASITAKDNYRGYSPLHWVAQHGDLQMVKYLVEKGAPIDDRTIDGETPVHLAAAHNRFPVLEYFLNERKAKFDIFEAAEKGYTSAVQYFIERKKKQASAIDADGLSVLHRAAYGGALSTIEFLVEIKGVNVNVSNVRRKTLITPLHAAAEKGHLDVVTYLVKKGADPNAKDFQGRTPLFWASYYGHKDLVAYFIDDLQSDSRERDSSGKTLLHATCYKGNPIVAQYLVERKRLDTNAQDDEDRTPFMECIQMRNNDVLEYLMEQKVSPANVKLADKSGNNALHYAAAKSDTNTIKELVKIGFDYKFQNHKNQTPLDVAKEVGNQEIVEFFGNNLGGEDRGDEKMVTPLVQNLDATGFKKADEQCLAYRRMPENANKRCLHVAAMKGDLALVKTLVRKGENINEMDEQGQTALYYAVEGGNLSMVRFLANEKGADVHLKYKNNYTLLHVAAVSAKFASSEIIKYLVDEKRMNVNERDNNMETPVFKTAVANNFNLCQFFIENASADFRISDKVNGTCLHWAAIHGNLNMLKWLVSKGDDVSTKNAFGRGALWYAVENHRFDVIRYLIGEKNLDVRVRDNDGNTLVHAAIFQNKPTSYDLIEYLVKQKGLNVNEQNNSKETPLFLAAIRGHMNLLQFFIEKMSADFRIREKGNGTVLHWTAIHGNLDLLKWLIAKGDDVYTKNGLGRGTLWYAVENHRFDVIRYLIEEKKLDIHERDNDGNIIVHAATFRNEPTSRDLIKYLVNEKKLNINERNNFGETPLFVAAIRGYMNLLQFFIEEMSADFRIRDKTMGTVLHWTAIHGNLDLLKWLIGKGDDVFTKNALGRGTLWYAVENHRLDVIRYLIEEKNLDIYARDNDGNTLVHAATFRNEPTSRDLIKYLVSEKELNLNEQNNFGETPVFVAAIRGYMNLLPFFIEEMSADYHIRDKRYGTILHWTAIHGDLNMLKWLVAKGDNVKFKNALGRDALWYAVENDRMNVVRYLAEEKKLDVREKDNDGSTLLHVAVSRGHMDIVKYLVDQAKLDLDVKDASGKTALVLAEEGQKKMMVEYLKSKGAHRRRRDVATHTLDPSDEAASFASNAAYRHYSIINCAVRYIQRVVPSTALLPTASRLTQAVWKSSDGFSLSNEFLILANVIGTKFFSSGRVDRALSSFASHKPNVWPSSSQYIEGRIDPIAETAVYSLPNFYEIENRTRSLL